MTDEKKPDVPAEDSISTGLNRFKTWILAITGVVVAVITLLSTVLDKGTPVVEKITGFFQTRPEAQEACVVINTPVIPPVKLSEWEETRIVLEGRNNCSVRRGVYVTFQRGRANGPRVRPPRFDKEGCDRGEPVTKTECWTQKIPVEKGPWEIKVPLPPLERLTNPAPRETILLTVEVRDLENPDKLPEWSHLATIEQRNDL